jgi:hypothetical protein
VTFRNQIVTRTSENGDIQGAIDSFVTGNGVVYIPAGSYKLSSGLRINSRQGHLTIKAAPDARIIRNFTGRDLLQIEGHDVSVIGGVWDGNAEAGSGNSVIVVHGAGRATIKDATVVNGSNLGIYAADATGLTVHNCHISGHKNIGIFVEHETKDAVITNNHVDQTGAGPGGHCIALHSTLGGKAVDRAVVANNVCLVGGASSFGIEIGSFGGDPPKDCVVTGNTVEAVAGCAGGISVGAASSPIVHGNTFHSNRKAISICAFEFVMVRFASVEGNTAIGDPGLRIGFSIDRTSHSAFTGNTVNRFGTASSAAAFFVIAGRPLLPECSENVFIGNRLIYSAHSGGVGFRLQINAADATLNNTVISDNLIEGVSIAEGGIGIHLQFSSGRTLAGSVLTGNRISQVETAIYIDPRVADTVIAGNVVQGNRFLVNDKGIGTRQRD